jgi:hypothetical protein
MRHDRMAVTSRVLTMTLPLLGVISCRSSLMIVDLPDPEGPMKEDELALLDGDRYVVQ